MQEQLSVQRGDGKIELLLSLPSAEAVRIGGNDRALVPYFFIGAPSTCPLKRVAFARQQRQPYFGILWRNSNKRPRIPGNDPLHDGCILLRTYRRASHRDYKMLQRSRYPGSSAQPLVDKCLHSRASMRCSESSLQYRVRLNTPTCSDRK